MLNRLWLLPIIALPLACTSPAERARADSAQALVAQQRVLMGKLVAQRDSVTNVLNDADTFVGQIDKSISRVKGLRKPSLRKRQFESGIDQQLQARKEMLSRVNALVSRAQKTARDLETAKEREQQLLAENGKLRDSVATDVKAMADLNASIERQAQTIAALQAHVDSLDKELNVARAAYSRAYYVVGTEGDLIQKGIIVKEGGANLLIARVGRTLVPARTLNRDLFTPIDTRQVLEIAMPDSSRRYQIVSRQSLEDAQVADRDGATFRGSLRIADVDKFWAPSRFLIVVQR